MSDTQQPIDYSAALNGAVFYPVPKAGYLRLQGADRLAFLQRQTSNDVSRLRPDRSLLTVLLTPTARILDVFRLIEESEQAVGALTLPGRAEATARYLQSRIFFMDKVSLNDASQELAQLELYGPSAGGLLTQLGVTRLPALDEVVTAEFAGYPLRAIGERGFSSMAYRLLISTPGQAQLQATLESSGAVRLSESSYHTLRVESGIPAAEFELTSEYTPLETGLRFAVAEGKGCYTGQEVIARQITYDKITQRLVGVRLKAQAAAGTRIWADGKPVGVVTSAAHSPRFGPIALAVVRKPYFQAGTNVIIENRQSEIVELPFTAHNPT